MRYITGEEAQTEFPDISAERKKSAVVFVDETGSVDGADAVFKTLSFNRIYGWLHVLYRHFFPFKAVCDYFYRLVAKNRIAFSKITKVLWGSHLEIPRYGISAHFFIKAIAVFYFTAFFSFWVQMPGLIGSNGILPAAQFMEAVQKAYGPGAFWMLPTLGWLSASDSVLHALCLGGMALSVILFLGYIPIVCAIILWLGYLSLVNLGQDFLSFQWDVLLLEVGFLLILLVPWSLTLAKKIVTKYSALTVWLFQWLLFRLMFRSGMVKLASGDPAWSQLEALNYHYETQPLPTWIGWYAHQLPDWFQSFSVFTMFVVELILPFLFFAPRRLRLFSAFSTMTLMILIMLTGNYCFFNLLTIALCFFLLDNAVWPKKIQSHYLQNAQRGGEIKPTKGIRTFLPQAVRAVLAVIIVTVSLMQLHGIFKPQAVWPKPFETLSSILRPFRVVNSYGLFAVMTRPRREIQIEGSHDGSHWQSYHFRWKPDKLGERPRFVQPHQPRLDWQMWFAALSNYRRQIWFPSFMLKLFEEEKAVLDLLNENPFSGEAPSYLRAVVYTYEFTNLDEKRNTGDWWKRKREGLYMPVMAYREGRMAFLKTESSS